MIVDISMWKPFRVGDLFDCETTLSVPSKNNLVDGDVSYITRSAVDNGLSGHCGNLDSVNVGRCITIGAEGFVAFWQPDDFVAGNKVYALRHSGLNELRALFVCAALNVLSSEYSFSNARILDSIKQEVILLPATPDGEPDWAYMEAYMRQVLDREEMFAEHLASLTAEAVADGTVVDTSAWKAFKVGDLFGIAKHGTYVNPRYLSSDADGFAIVSASTKNNGVSDDRYACDESFLIPSGVVTWGKQSPLFAYQTEVTIPGQGVYYYDVTALSKYQALFICSVMQSAVASKYDYQECLIGSKMDDEFVLLPATPDGAPDWAYMERYMRGVMAVEALFADELDRLSRE